VPLGEEDNVKTAFGGQVGHFELCTSPARARVINQTNTVTASAGNTALIYVGDTVLYGAVKQEHSERLTEVSDSSQVRSLRLQLDQSEFLRREVCYLGRKVAPDGVKPDEGKAEAVMKCPVPQNTKQLKAFLGFVGYYRIFIPSFGPVANQLHKSTGKNVSYVRGKAPDGALQKLQYQLRHERLLQRPDVSKQFVDTAPAQVQPEVCEVTFTPHQETEIVVTPPTLGTAVCN
jgi:hypothetical protein